MWADVHFPTGKKKTFRLANPRGYRRPNEGVRDYYHESHVDRKSGRCAGRSLMSDESAYNSLMCACFTLRTPSNLLAVRFGLPTAPDLRPRFNIAPSQQIPVIGAKAGGHGRGLAIFKWGFVPHWANDAHGTKPFNARAETVATTPMFSESFRQRQCIIPANGFYEWKTVNKRKMPVHFRLKSGEPFGVADVWDVWNGPMGKVFTVAILTTSPNELTREVHDRMRVILGRGDEAGWLDPANHNAAKLQAMLRPYSADEMEAVQVNPALNKPSFEGPECLDPPTIANHV
jgi:putative SOS response-associated peptidase YedK